jgi:hypothetical protein
MSATLKIKRSVYTRLTNDDTLFEGMRAIGMPSDRFGMVFNEVASSFNESTLSPNPLVAPFILIKNFESSSVNGRDGTTHFFRGSFQVEIIKRGGSNEELETVSGRVEQLLGGYKEEFDEEGFVVFFSVIELEQSILDTSTGRSVKSTIRCSFETGGL